MAIEVPFLTVSNLTAATSNVTAAVNETTRGILPVFTSFIPLLFVRLWDLVAAPFRHAEMLWIVFPLFFSLFVMEFYYDRHMGEELGWGAAVANSLILIFVAIDLIKTSFGHATPWHVLKIVALAVFSDGALPIAPQVLVLILFVGAMGLAVTLINYFHLLPRKLAFAVSGHPPINFLAYFAIAIVYSSKTEHPIPFDFATLGAGLLFFLLLLLLVFCVKRYIPTLFAFGQDDSVFRR